MAIKTEPRGPKPPLPGLIKVAVNYVSQAGSVNLNAANIMHVMATPVAPLGLIDLGTFLTAFKTAWETRFKPYRSTFWASNLYTATYLDGSGVTTSVTGNTVGTAAGNNIAPSTALCLSWQGNFYWRGGRPRTYLPGPTTSMLTNVGSAQLASATTAPLATAAFNFLSDVAAITAGGKVFALGFPSYYSKGAFRATPIFYGFTNAVVHDRLDSQRRRSGKERNYGID